MPLPLGMRFCLREQLGQVGQVLGAYAACSVASPYVAVRDVDEGEQHETPAVGADEGVELSEEGRGCEVGVHARQGSGGRSGRLFKTAHPPQRYARFLQ